MAGGVLSLVLCFGSAYLFLIKGILLSSSGLPVESHPAHLLVSIPGAAEPCGADGCAYPVQDQRQRLVALMARAACRLRASTPVLPTVPEPDKYDTTDRQFLPLVLEREQEQCDVLLYPAAALADVLKAVSRGAPAHASVLTGMRLRALLPAPAPTATPLRAVSTFPGKGFRYTGWP